MKRRLAIGFLAIAILTIVAFGINGIFVTSTYNELELQVPLSELHEYRVVRVWITILNLRPPSPHLILVDTRGREFRIPEQFQEIVRQEMIKVTTPQKALEVARTYVLLTGSYGEVLILSNMTEIPGIARNPPSKQLEVTPARPRVSPTDQGFLVELYSWKELRGLIEQWTIVIDRQGDMQITSQQLATNVGDATGLL